MERETEGVAWNTKGKWGGEYVNGIEEGNRWKFSPKITRFCCHAILPMLQCISRLFFLVKCKVTLSLQYKVYDNKHAYKTVVQASFVHPFCIQKVHTKCIQNNALQ